MEQSESEISFRIYFDKKKIGRRFFFLFFQECSTYELTPGVKDKKIAVVVRSNISPATFAILLPTGQKTKFSNTSAHVQAKTNHWLSPDIMKKKLKMFNSN